MIAGSDEQMGSKAYGAMDGTDRWYEAVDRYRDVAKWLITAFGAIGVLIAGTAPLARIGDARSDRIGYVVAGGATAMIGVAAVFAATIAVLVPRTVYRHELKAKRHGRFRRTFLGLSGIENLLAEHPEELLPPGIDTVEELGQALTNLRLGVTTIATLVARLGEDDRDRAEYERAANAMLAAHTSHEQALQYVLHVARYERARSRFNQAVLIVFVGGVAIAIGLALTLYGTASKTMAAPIDNNWAQRTERSAYDWPMPLAHFYLDLNKVHADLVQERERRTEASL